jgi:DNA polymerase-1
VHDELVFDVLKSEVDDIKKLVLQDMQTALTLPNGVPVIAESGVGDNWLTAH